MIEVEDKSTVGDEPITVRQCTYVDHVALKSESGQTFVHKDTWPVLKEAIETTFKQMEVKLLIRKEDRTSVAHILLATAKFPLGEVLDALERGYA